MNMKMLNLPLLLCLVMVLLFACQSSPEGKKVEAKKAEPVKKTVAEDAGVYKLDTQTSTVLWEGAKPGTNHKGSVRVSDGNLDIKDGELLGGKFYIDMNSISNQDIAAEGMRKKLEGHLKSADFFDVAKYPTAKFEITKVEKINGKSEGRSGSTHNITGNFTMKDATKSITFGARILIAGNMLKAKSERFTIDRTDWNVRYGSGKFFDNLKDKAIDDEIGLTISLKAKK